MITTKKRPGPKPMNLKDKKQTVIFYVPGKLIPKFKKKANILLEGLQDDLKLNGSKFS